MTNTTLRNLMQAATPAIDLALEGQTARAIALFVAEGATAEQADHLVSSMLETIAAKERAVVAAQREIERQARIEYNIGCGMSRWHAEAVS